MEHSNPPPNNKITKNINGTKGLFLMEPLRIIGGTISRCSRNSTIKECQPLQSTEYNAVVQETELGPTPTTELGPTQTTAAEAEATEAVATKKVMAMEEQGRRKIKINTEPSSEPSTEPSELFLILPSYTDNFKEQINNILAKINKNSAAIYNSRKLLKMSISELLFQTVETF